MAQDIQLFTHELPSTSELFTFGTMRLAQRFVMELLVTEKSIKYLPTRGCYFLAQLKRCISEFDILSAFAAAKVKISRTLVAEEQTSTPINERFSNARIEQIIFEPDALTLRILVISRAKTAAFVNTPKLSLD